MPIFANTKTRIIEVANKLFAKYVYADVSMNQIANALNITKAALYYHYPSKVVIYKHVLNKTYRDFNQHLLTVQIEKTPTQKLYRLIERYLSFNLSQSSLIRIIITKSPNNLPDLSRAVVRFRKQIYSLIHSYAKEIADELDSYISVAILINIMDGLLLEHSFSSKRLNSEKIAKQATMTLLNISSSK